VRAELDLRRTVNLVQALLVATTACAAALVIGAAARLWLGTEVADSPRAGAKEQAEPAEQAHKARADYSAIFERNLFGSEPIVDTGSGAVAHADLLLRGTAQFGGTGYAVIENADSGLQQLFAVGDAVFDGPKLVAVEARTATLMRGGRKVVLEITWRGTHKGALTTPKGPIAPTGKQIELRSCVVCELAGEKTKVQRQYFDMGTLLQQIGVGG